MNEKMQPYQKSLILKGALMMISGAVVFYFQRTGAQSVVSSIFYFLSFTHFVGLIGGFFNKEASAEPPLRLVFRAIFWFSMGALTELTNTPINLIIRFVGVYQIINGLIKMIMFYLYKATKTKGAWRFMFDGIILIDIGIGALFLADQSAGLQFLLIGGYLFFLGATYLRDGIMFEREKSYRDLKRKVRVSLPVWLVAIMPQVALSEVNKKLLGEDNKPSQLAKEKFEPSDLQVMVHTAAEGFNRVGHVDICYKGTVISYGNYDENSLSLFGTIGDGVLFEVEKSEYIEFCKTVSGKTLFEYGLKLTPEQNCAIEAQIRKIKDLAYEWHPDEFSKIEIKKGVNMQKMYSFRLKNELDAKLYKFSSGKFKKYFVLGTNCVLLADSIVGASGTDTLSLNGVIAPGTYLDYLDKEFAKPKSIVVSKIIHKQE